MIRTRFAPSPTGALHIGGLRTALYSFALAKHDKGEFILRIEDTDIKREVEGSKERIKEILKLFGMDWDGYFVQSDRAREGIYKKAAEALVEAGHAFYCDCKPRNAKEEGYSKELRDPCRDAKKKEGAIKLMVPDGEHVGFRDFVLDKEVTWETSTVADTTLLKSDGFPTYHLAVVVDDHDMDITHVLRGHDWMPSTPVHLLVYKCLGYEKPEIGHLTDILDPEGGKLSKRKGSTSVDGLLKEGYLPEAVLNFIMLLGWAPKDNRELFSLEEFVKAFDHKGFQKSNPVFNKEKLDWFNGEYIRQKSDTELMEVFKPFIPEGADEEKVKKVIPLIKDRIKTLADFKTMAGFLFEVKTVDPTQFGENHKIHLQKAAQAIAGSSDLMKVVEENKFKTGDFFMDLRIAIAGSRVTPPITDSIAILGKEETLARLKKFTD
ncbi:MAG TPA: glutamate--tRNA ligase [Patescibacteria group bacterium]|nr:glutamate--tRNA ligase [Patescibacteria group bacterium]